MKHCPTCNRDLPDECFSSASFYKRKLQYQCKECTSKYHKAYLEKMKASRDKEARVRIWVKGTLNNHYKKGYIIDIDINELRERALFTVYCEYCGKELDWFKDGKGHAHNSPSLDRINNGKIISNDTISIVCAACNSGKKEQSLKDYVEQCKRVVEKFGETYEES